MSRSVISLSARWLKKKKEKKLLECHVPFLLLQRNLSGMKWVQRTERFLVYALQVQRVAWGLCNYHLIYDDFQTPDIHSLRSSAVKYDFPLKNPFFFINNMWLDQKAQSNRLVLMWAVKTWRGRRENNQSQIDSRPVGDFPSHEILVLTSLSILPSFFFQHLANFPNQSYAAALLKCKVNCLRGWADILIIFTWV